jgi:anti-sigma B factor antagonist
MAATADLEPGSFDIERVVHPNRMTLVLAGELDIASADGLQDAVARACADGARKIVLDLTGLTFIDSTGIRAFAASQVACRDRDVEFVLTPAQGSVRRVFEIAGLLDVLPFARVAI